MEYFIHINNGNPIGTPIPKQVFIETFPHIDIINLPPDFARFEKTSTPVLGPYEKNQRYEYVIRSDGVCTDVWYKDDMTLEEIKFKQDSIKLRWANSNKTPKSWVFNDNICDFSPPIPFPSDGKRYIWVESTGTWDEYIGDTPNGIHSPVCNFY